MPLKLFNAPFESSSMSCTYPPTTKSSKQSTHGTSKPIMRNSLNHSPLFFLRSSEPSLRYGHRCRHCGSLHSRVSCVWSSCSLNCWCGYIVFHKASSIYGFLCSTFVRCVCVCVFSMILVYGFLDPSCNTVVSLPTSVVNRERG